MRKAGIKRQQHCRSSQNAKQELNDRNTAEDSQNDKQKLNDSNIVEDTQNASRN